MLNANLIVKPDSYTNSNAIENAIRYIFRLDNNQHFIYRAWPPTPDNAIALFKNIRKAFPDNTCEQQLQHFFITFNSICDKDFINSFSHQVASLFINAYPICFALHDDKPKHLHTHFIVSTTSHIPNTLPLINSTWKSYEKKIIDLASHYQINLQRIQKHV